MATSTYEPDLPDNATTDQIVAEINFVDILKTSALEQPNDDTAAYVAHLDEVQADLKQRFEEANETAQQPAVPSNWQEGQWGGHGYQNGFMPQADLGGDLVSPLTPAGESFAGSASSSHFETPGASISTPFELPGISLKRSRTHSTYGPSHLTSKRHSSNPSPSTTSSQSPYSIDDDDDQTDFEFGGAASRPTRGEASLAGSYNTNGRQAGVGLGSRKLPWSASSIKAENRHSLGRPTQLPTRPHLQQRKPSNFGSIATPSSSSNVNRLSAIKYDTGTSQSPWDLDDPDGFPPAPPVQPHRSASNGFRTQNNDSVRFGHSSSLGPSNRNVNSHGYNSGASGSYQQGDIVDLTGDSPTDLTQDDPFMSWVEGNDNNLRNDANLGDVNHLNSLAPSNGFSAYGAMPGAFPNDPFIDLDSAYTGQQTNNGPLRGQYTPAPAYSNQGSQLMNSDLQIGAFETTDWMTNDHFARLLGVGPLPESTSLTGLTSGPEYDHPQPPHHGLLTRMGLGNLEDEYAVRSPEELKKLLENIRPDEDLPPELREQTPIQMDATLMEHQKLGLTWLRKMEEGSNKGGILADDMGLGKTVQALSLILARPSDDPLRKTTLIIAPVALMRQWEKEIKTKVKVQHQLKVHVYHGAGKRCNFNRLRQNDVVLTTFGTLGAEFKKKKELVNRMAGQQAENLAALEELPLVGEKCKWYRVIIDEAQCIKNKSTLNAQAAMELQSIHRLCMTGTPMMNSVDELYSLIRFLRIRPYDVWSEFNLHFARPIKSTNNSERNKQNAMKKLQALLKAILLRRTKSSLIDGKPIITIPPKHVHQVQVTFSPEELELYKALESKTQLTFNKYLRQNSVQNNYANILVLLLRLRQMCCHPHLINDLSINTSVKDIPENDLKAMAAQLGKDVVTRLKGHEGEGFECPVCYDGVTNPTIFIPCGHNTCSDCFTKLVDPQRAIQAGDERAQPRCPECRNDIRHDRITDFQHFVKVHMPEKLRESGDANEDDDEDGDSSSDSDESEDDGDKTLGGFIVDDEDEGVTDNDDGDADESKMQKPKSKRSKSKGKGKAKKANPDKPMKFKKTLAQLKKESMRNKAAKAKYIRRLKADWETSAKIEKTVEVLQGIEDNDPSEKTIVFSQFTSLLDLLEVPLSEKGLRYERYDGSMKASDRVDAVNKFMETSTCKLMLISLKAGNAGLNLNKASHVIILDPFWNPYIEEQAVDRAHRMMQKREVHVHRLLVPGTVEDRILELQERKREMISMALDETAAKGIARLGRRELGFLFGVNALD